MTRSLPSATAPSIRRLTLATITLAALTSPALSQTLRYFHDAHGIKGLRELPDTALVYVAPADDAPLGTRPAFLPDAVIPAELPDSARALETRMANRGWHVVRGADPANLHATRGVSAVLPVYETFQGVPLYPTDRIIVALADGAARTQLDTLAQTFDAEVVPLERGKARYLLKLHNTAAVDLLDAANALHENVLTKYAHPDFFVPKVALSPPQIDDPLYADQWHLDGDILKGAAPGSDINAEAAWDTDNGPAAEGLPEIRIAVLDECVEKFHPDLFPNWATGRDYDVDPPDDDPSPTGGQRHGTSCAGVAVAKGNIIGVRGSCPNCGLIGVKFFGATISESADSFYFCMDPDNNGDHSDGAAIYSNSWGYADGTLLPSDMVNALNTVALESRNGLGGLILFASANSDHTVNGVTALAQLESTLAIGGTNSNARHTEFSDVGPELVVVAPTNDRGDDGVRFPWIDITTVDNTGDSGYNGLPDLDYTNAFGGTSSATPLAAGVYGLVLSQDPTLTANAANAIVQHTAVPVDAPWGRFDPITGHSHRLGFGKVDAGAAVDATRAGIRWPARIKSMSAAPGLGEVVLTWDTPTANYSGSLVVRSAAPFAWAPTDGVSYPVGTQVAPGVEVVYSDTVGTYLDQVGSGAWFYAVYPYSSTLRYGFGAKDHVIFQPLELFADNSEIPDPGWTTGGAGNDWQRGEPTSVNGVFGQFVGGSGPLAGTRGIRAIEGDKCWGTDLFSTYNPFADAWLQTPLINLENVSVPVLLEYWDWCLLETTYDVCTVEVYDSQQNFLGYLDPDTGGDYDWTARVYDLAPYLGQAIHIRFRLQSDGMFQRDGWFIDNVRVVAAGNIAAPPVAENLYAEGPENTGQTLQLQARDPNPGTFLAYVITALPEHGTLFDPQAGVIDTVPYTLASNGVLVNYEPDLDYQGPDSFTYRADDGALLSNEAVVELSIGTPNVIFDFPLDSDPGWVTDGQWQFGIPQGLGGDPPGAFTGLYVYGYNLAGEYENNLPPQYLTTLPMNCTGLSRVTLRFARWLGVESSSYDGAGIEVTSDGVNWVTVWSHSGATIEDEAWAVYEYNIADVADDAAYVQVRWVLGPTDEGDTYAGWNIDDVQILGIGSAAGNQPPFARNVLGSTAEEEPLQLVLEGVDSDSPALDYVIESLPVGGALLDANNTPIDQVPYVLPAGPSVVTYLPDPGFAGIDVFNYRVSDGALDSNLATVSIDVLRPAPFPYTQDFESGGPLEVWWKTNSTGTGRIQITSLYEPLGMYHLTMDSSQNGSESANELDLIVDLAGASFARLEYDWKDFGDEADPLPASWVGSVPGDGVAISADGVHWYKVADLFDPGRADNYTNVVIDLDAATAAAGIAYTNTFRIRFQQIDNRSLTTDGIALDNIKLVQGTSDPVITTASLPNAVLAENYGPAALSVAGGDAPLSWELVDTYGAASLGENQYAAVGDAQGWQGGNDVFSYTLPFAFPFYDELHTDVLVASDGWINFGPYVGATQSNSELLLSYNKRIAVLWDNLRTDQPGNDIYLDESVPGEVTIRWVGVTHSTLSPVEFAATLYQDGRIRFHYGPGNTNLTPTVGVSAGDTVNYSLLTYDGAGALTNADSLEIERSRLPAGISLSPSGVLSGAPAEAGAYKPIFRVEDASGRSAQKLIPLLVIPQLFGDFDRDGDVDADDFEQFNACMDLSSPDGACLDAFDADDNGRVDLADFAELQTVYTGPLGG